MMGNCSKTWMVMLTGFIIATASASEADDPLNPNIPLPSKITEVCPASMLRPFSLKKNCSGTPEAPVLSGCKGVWLGVGCRDWNADNFVSLVLEYFQFNIEHNEFFRHVDFNLYREPFEQFVQNGAHGMFKKSEETDLFIPDENGLPQLAGWNLENGCGQDNGGKIHAAPISYQNWKGWMWEQSFSVPKKKLPQRCSKLTPTYRCVTLAFGNDKVSAAFPMHCFLRKKVDHLDDELSFDVFMDIVKTIRFKEGAANR